MKGNDSVPLDSTDTYWITTFVADTELNATKDAELHESWSLPSRNVYSAAGDTILLGHKARWRVWCL